MAAWKLFQRRRPPLSSAHWANALAQCRYARALPAADRNRLREIATAFLAAKSFDGAADFEITPEVRAVVAVKASVPILNLALDYYDGWRDIVVYPGDFRVRGEYLDDTGVLHQEARELCGESLSQGPIVLSWQAMQEEQEADDRDLVIHECTHKLDISNGDANGLPPLHANMSVQRWAEVFNDAFERFGHAVDQDEQTALDPYAATDAAEFFAVSSETFFTCPAILHYDFPAVYEQLAMFYRQDPYALLGDPT